MIGIGYLLNDLDIFEIYDKLKIKETRILCVP